MPVTCLFNLEILSWSPQTVWSPVRMAVVPWRKSQIEFWEGVLTQGVELSARVFYVYLGSEL